MRIREGLGLSSRETKSRDFIDGSENGRAAATSRLDVPGRRSIPPRRLPGIRYLRITPRFVRSAQTRLYFGPSFATVHTS